MSCRNKPWLVTIGVLVIAASARADIIILKNGSVYRGKVVGTNSTGVEFQRGGFTIHYASPQIRDLYVESDADSAPSTSPGLEKVKRQSTSGIARLGPGGYSLGEPRVGYGHSPDPLCGY